jgi:hypothetical protein
MVDLLRFTVPSLSPAGIQQSNFQWDSVEIGGLGPSTKNLRGAATLIACISLPLGEKAFSFVGNHFHRVAQKWRFTAGFRVHASGSTWLPLKTGDLGLSGCGNE